MKKLIDYLPTGAVVFEAKEPFRALYVNEVFLQTIGYPREEIIQEEMQGDKGIFYDAEHYIFRVAMREARKKGWSGEYECHMKHKDGSSRWYVFRIRYIEDTPEGDGYVMAVWDVDERKRVEEEYYVQIERQKLLEMITGELPLDYDVESKEYLVSRKYLTMRNQNEVLEHFAKEEEWEDIFYKQDIPVFMQAMEAASRHEIKDVLELRLNVSNKPNQDEYAWYRLIYKSIPGVDGKIIRVVGRMTNINQQKLEHYELSERIKKDSLTGILNKIAAKEAVENFLPSASEQRHALMVIDIDDFKSVNDNFGHLFGDTVLISIAEKLVSTFRKDDIIGRVGGDEFLVLMKNVHYQDVVEKASYLCRELWQKYQGEGKEIVVSTSVGIAFYNQDGSTYEELFDQADYAMYLAKDAGKNQYRFAEKESQMVGLRKQPGGEQRKAAGTIKGQDESFLSSAFFLLAHAREVNTSMNLLLERIGKRYNLDVVSILEDEGEGDTFVQTNCWRKERGIISEPTYLDSYQNWKSYMTGFDERGLLCVNDYEALGITEQQPRLRSGRIIRAMIGCRFACQNGRDGMILFCDMTRERIWTEFEKETFLEIAQIISVFVALRSNQIENQNTILSLKSRDPITGLLNDSAFREAAAEKLANREEGCVYAMVYTDIREFSYVNENFGYEAGNQILKKFATAISSAPKVLSCRLHSDLFVTLVWDESRDIIERVVEKTVREFSETQRKYYPKGNLHLVAGIYFMEPGDDVDTAIENANLTRKQVKKDTVGSFCQIYNDEIRIRREKEKRIISQFEQDIKEGRFLIYIQPKFILNTLEMDGGEALVRWQKQDGSMEYPGDFIPVLERTGFIVDLDFYVLEQVLRCLQDWKRQGKKLYRISVNFSRKHFEGSGIHERICKLVEAYGVEPEYIEIEITESLLVSEPEKVKEEMAFLRKAGFKVAIDDFGTGYSSLSMLHDIPADIVKIDRSFLNKNDMERERDFIEKIGALIQSVKEEVIFEGIETRQQLEFLVDCGFRYGQGYLYDQPLPIKVFEEKYIK